MYPTGFEINDTTESNTSASYLDLLLSIGRDGQLRTSNDKGPHNNRTLNNKWQHKNNATTNFDYTTIADWLRAVSW